MSEPLPDSTEATPTSTIEKLQRYLGLLVAIALVAFVVYPVEETPRGMKRYLERTALNTLIMQLPHGKRARALESDALACAEFVVETSPGMAPAQGIDYMGLNTRCVPERLFGGLASGGVGFGELLEADPDFYEKLDNYIDHRKRVALVRGYAADAIPPWTPELVDSGRPVVILLLNEYQRSVDWLSMARVLMSALLLILAGCCVILRNEVGALLLSPIRLLFGVGRGAAKVASEVHKRV